MCFLWVFITMNSNDSPCSLAAPFLSLADLLCRAEAIQHGHSSRGDPAGSLQIGTLSIHWMFFGKFAHSPFSPQSLAFKALIRAAISVSNSWKLFRPSSRVQKYETAVSDMKRKCKCKHLEGTVEDRWSLPEHPNHPESSRIPFYICFIFDTPRSHFKPAFGPGMLQGANQRPDPTAIPYRSTHETHSNSAEIRLSLQYLEHSWTLIQHDSLHSAWFRWTFSPPALAEAKSASLALLLPYL